MLFVIGCRCRKQYTIFTFLWDLFMCSITGGLWIIYIAIRQARRNSCGNYQTCGHC